MKSAAENYKIYAIEYFRREASTTDLVLRPSVIETVDMSYFVWAIVGENQTIAVDSGFKPEAGLKRGRQIDTEIGEAFASVGVDTAQVDKVIITHLHWDHAGCLDLFPQARFFIQQDEMLFWSGPYGRYHHFREVVEPDDISLINRLNLEGRVSQLRGEARIAPGVKLHLVGGHTPGMQIVEVDTPRGTAIIASDAVKTYRNLAENAPEPFLHDVPGMLHGYEVIRSLVKDDSLVFSGHDPQVLDRFTRVGPNAVVLD
jgi:glyoxylase-like metal-dependent hydrolase (beta-lactamase superfamily II)